MRKDDAVSDSPGQPASPFAVRGRVVTPTGVVDDGVVVVDGGLIAWVGPARDVPARWAEAVRASGSAAGLVLPGLVDLHNHGGGGGSFPDATTATEAATAIAEHRRHGTTSLVASLVTAPRDELLARTALLAGLAGAGELAGIHLEGPFLSHARCGAQNPDDMLAGDPALVRDVAAAARGHLVTMTVAPEVPGVVAEAPGADDVLAALVSAGAVPSIGHTDASAEQVDAAVARGFDLLATDGGARSGRLTATHLFNGMRPLHHRDPGPIAACLAAAARGELVVELVADGTHLADGTVRSVFDLVGADAIALVTDAMAAAGMPDGEYQLGPKAVTVAGGVARLSGPDGAIAGGVAHLVDVVRQVVAAGIPLADAVRAASTTPAAVLGRHDVGALVAGRRADVLVTDGDLRPVAVYRGGARVA
ncbi:N-acetylglucosamine-6-phosphate deacetylase [Cellulomonas alba]|uniref:Amidohydrolase family protein n=1 Tax=Cellulomonas alba TaxID=3053467 RepID=A0ABT7SHW2_9CELL|nr:amidohydrolase family protein [Cellulomonas alba]MDM7855777.1 amidohydrolase family protein [Cellulomonas alba]